MKYRVNVMVVLTGICFTVPQFAIAGEKHGHHDDFTVGVSGTGQLGLEFDFDDIIELPPADGLITGWAADDPGFASLDMDEPKEDFFMLGSGAEISFEFISGSPALSVWSPGFGSQVNQMGEQFIIGADEFDVHPTFHIDLNDPSYDPNLTDYSLSFRLVDGGSTNYANSEVYSVNFAAVPEPATLSLLVLGAGFCLRRNRERNQSEGTA
ncbi:MAG: PEP-CTERM sorting domain-containing protein [Phycisphaerae bacterium]